MKNFIKKIKTGDRIVVKDGMVAGIKCGVRNEQLEGTVIGITNEGFGVEFDYDIGGNSASGTCPKGVGGAVGYCWNFWNCIVENYIIEKIELKNNVKGW